jgi:hypothetical protein
MSKYPVKPKAVIINGRVEIVYRCKIFKFNWEAKDLILATDADGEVWAFDTQPTKRTDIAEWDGATWHSYERCIGDRSTIDWSILPVKNWENSVVTYCVEIK